MRPIDTTAGLTQQINAREADRLGIPMGDDDCRMCHGKGYLETLGGPIGCPCTIPKTSWTVDRVWDDGHKALDEILKLKALLAEIRSQGWINDDDTYDDVQKAFIKRIDEAIK
jgi:hypothetical protein